MPGSASASQPVSPPATQGPPAAPAYASPPPAAPPSGGSRTGVLVLVLVVLLLLGGLAAAFAFLGPAQEGNCVLRYQFEGTVVHEGWTRSECDQWCQDNLQPAGRALECYFDPY